MRTVAVEQNACVDRLRQLCDDDLAVRSTLPGWSRGHVAAHLAGNARAHARQLIYAARSQIVPMYEGGNDARVAAIELSAQQGSAKLIAELQAAHADVLSAAQVFTAQTSSARVSYRRGTVHDLMQARLMELHLHQIDLNLRDCKASSIPTSAAKSIIRLLAARVPDGQQWRLNTPEFSVAIGAGDRVKLRGTAGSLACLLADRAYQEIIIDGHPRQLQPWPDRKSALNELQFSDL
ncbi:MAG: maleylpyruvate isomerase family mycothiol-dependent enzyme [Antricoccus sp.]